MDRDELPRSEQTQYIPLLLDFARRRRRLIATATAIAVVLSLGGAGVVLLRAPRQTEARCHFRLEFNGAERGVYPSGLPFVPQEITARAAVRRVYHASGLADSGVPLGQFLRGLYIVESDPALDRLRAEANASLAAARTQIERDNVAELFALRRRNQLTREYDLVLSLPTSSRLSPEQMKRALTLLLETWAATTGREKARIDVVGVTARDINEDTIPSGQPLVALEDLRLKTIAGMLRASALAGMEGAALVRDPGSGMTAKMVESELSNIVRWNIDPQVAGLLRRRVYDDYTIDALNSQIRYDIERKMFSDERSRIIQQGVATYGQTTAGGATASAATPATPATPRPESADEPDVVAQVDASLLDRLADLTGQRADQSYRQYLTNQFLQERTLGVPTEIEIRHFRSLLEQLTTAAGPRATPTDQDLAAVRAVTARVRSNMEVLDAIAARVSEARVFSGMLFSADPVYVHARRYVPTTTIAIVTVTPLLLLPIILLVAFVAEHLGMAYPAAPRDVSAQGVAGE